jgi:hypothetical protein
MAKAVVKKDYSRLIARFESEGQRQLQKINQKRQAYAEEIISFALMVKGWREEAVAQDNGKEGSCYRAVDGWFKRWTAENLGDKYQVYHWNTIARAANVLSSPRVLPHLPNTKMAIFHLAKATKGDRSADLQQFKTWIDEGALTSELTVSGAKRLGESTNKRVMRKVEKRVPKSADKRKLITALERGAVLLNVSVNSLPLQKGDKPAFHKGLAVALLSSEVDSDSGTEIVKILSVLNDENALDRVIEGLGEAVP